MQQIAIPSRRTVLLGLSALPIAALSPPARSAPLLRYTAATAPDAIGREILARPLNPMVHTLMDPDTLAQHVRATLPVVLEQNFARLNGRRQAQLLKRMTAAERDWLAQAYTNAIHNTRHVPRLLPLLATRLPGDMLAQLARHFGFAPIYDAVLRHAPAKVDHFLYEADTNIMSPVPGMRPPAPAVMRPTSIPWVGGAEWRRGLQRTTEPSLELTIYETYLHFRTAPVGALGPAAAAYQTANFVARPLTRSFAVGYTIGTGISMLLQTYAPAVHNAIGAGIHHAVNTLASAFSSGSIMRISNAQTEGAHSFGLAPIVPILQSTGGDFGSVREMSQSSGGSDCGGEPDGCPIQQ